MVHSDSANMLMFSRYNAYRVRHLSLVCYRDITASHLPISTKQSAGMQANLHKLKCMTRVITIHPEGNMNAYQITGNPSSETFHQSQKASSSGDLECLYVFKMLRQLEIF